jgi:hypothetical protein
MRFRRHMAKQTKLGFSFTPRHWPTFTSTDLTDCAGKIAQVGGHAQIFAPWGEQTPVANLAVIKSLCDAQGLAFHLTHDPIGMPQRTQPNIPPQFGTSFTEPAVRSAFIARVMDLASLQPARLGLAAEVNLLWPNSTEYVALVSLTQETYAAVKAAYPLLPLFISFQWDHMLMSVDPLRFQPLADFEASLDFRALTSYPPAWDILTSFPTWYSCFRLLYPWRSARSAMPPLRPRRRHSRRPSTRVSRADSPGSTPCSSRLRSSMMATWPGCRVSTPLACGTTSGQPRKAGTP